MCRRLALALALTLSGTLAACGDDNTTTLPKTCADDPTLPQCPKCDLGKVKGRICAPDKHTFIAGADVYATGTCGDKPYSIHGIADAAGNFEIELPEGDRALLARSGSFQRTYNAKVVANTETELPADSLCFDQSAARIGVITGPGDKIEDLLTSLGFDRTLIPGNGDAFYKPGGGRELLLSPEKLSQYDVLFIDCAAAKRNGKIDFGGSESTIGNNLKNFVQNGGSLYASDWAFAFVKQAFSEIYWKFAPGGGWHMPFDTNDLMGFAAQTIDASVLDQPLASYLQKDSVKITFPKSPPSLHWGLIERVTGAASVLISGDAKLCDTANDSGDKTKGVENDAPLAVQLDLTPNEPGGAVIYTSFHNIAQETGDVGNILKYLIFKL